MASVLQLIASAPHVDAPARTVQVWHVWDKAAGYFYSLRMEDGKPFPSSAEEQIKRNSWNGARAAYFELTHATTTKRAAIF